MDTQCQACLEARQELIDLVNKQVGIKGLWMRPLSILETRLQHELREIHQAVEDYVKGTE